MKIVVLDGYTLNPGDLDWSKFKEFGNLTIYDRSSRGEILERCAGAEIVFTNKTPLNGEVLSQLPDLKYIGVLATGYNIVDIEAAKRLHIVVTNVPGYGTASVVQMTFALILELCLHVQRHSDAVKEGRWSASQDFCFWDFPLIELSGKTIGIIGFGNIGEKVGDLATAFGMNIIASRRRQTDQAQRKNFRWVELNELFEKSDIVSIHCPLNNETEGIINKKSLSLMKRSAIIINTSRGPIIEENDLAEALNEGVIAGAGLDVLSTEPPKKENPLLSSKNCIITPHISWATKEARSRLMDLSLNNLSSFLSGKPTNVITL
jgi:glycerate dehydrogenase